LELITLGLMTLPATQCQRVGSTNGASRRSSVPSRRIV